MTRNNTIHFVCERGKENFAQPILDELDMKIVKRFGSNDLTHFINSFGAKNMWVEWATHPAIIISKTKRPWQKLIIRLHRYEMYRKKWMRKIKWKNVDCVVFVNSELEREFTKTVCNSVKTITIPNAIEIEQFQPTEITNHNTIVTYSLQFLKRKAYHKLINLFSKIVVKNPTFQLTIAAQEPQHNLYKNYYESCKLLIKEKKLTNNVQLKILKKDPNELKMHNTIKGLLINNNAVISYSDNESFHYAFAEGLVSGLQGFCRGWGELDLKEFWNDWCYDNEQQMIDGILKWGETSIEERQRIAKNNRKYIVDNFSSEVIAEKYYNLFKNL